MRFIETRGNDGVKPKSVEFSDALLSPNASFGGLYAPISLPTIDGDFLLSCKSLSYKELAKKIVTTLGVDIEPNLLDEALKTYDSFDDKSVVPLKEIGKNLHSLELWHGPTRAFKDMALQPFGTVFSALAQKKNKKYLVMTATSGDTGPAALSSLHNKPNVKVVCLYPEGGTSDVQRMQMLDLNKDNLKVVSINGAFDDAQNALKSMLGDKNFIEEATKLGYEISAANSVNFGRILFQTIYHFNAYLRLLESGKIGLGESINIIVPSGNFGNALGAYYAKRMGLPVAKITIASNANDILTDFLKHGEYDLTKRSLVKTIAPAMDILISSNVERIVFDKFGHERTKELMSELVANKKYKLKEHELKALQEDFDACSGSDSDSAKTIAKYLESGYLMDPHTALGVFAYEPCEKQTVVCSTAEWTKFAPDIAKALGADKLCDKDAIGFIEQKTKISAPKQIKELLDKTLTLRTPANIHELENEALEFLKA